MILTIGVAADSNIVIFERIKEEVRAGRSMLSAISEGYRKGIATIIDANVIILLTAFILFGLATAGVKGFAFTLGIGTIVSLFTAVLFTQAIFGLLGRANFLRRPSFLGAERRGPAVEIRLHRRLEVLLLALRVHPGDRRDRVRDQAAQPRHRLRVRDADRGGAAKPATVDQVRQALEDGGIDGAGDAKIQTATNPEFGNNVFQIQAQISPERDQQGPASPGPRVRARDGNASFDSTTVGPTFGQEVAKERGRSRSSSRCS